MHESEHIVHALDRKKWKNLLISGGKGDSGEGSSDCE